MAEIHSRRDPTSSLCSALWSTCWCFNLFLERTLCILLDLDTTFIKGKNRVVFIVLLRGLRDGSAGKMLTALTEDTGSVPCTYGTAVTGGSDFWPPWALALRCTPSHIHILEMAGNLWCFVESVFSRRSSLVPWASLVSRLTLFALLLPESFPIFLNIRWHFRLVILNKCEDGIWKLSARS